MGFPYFPHTEEDVRRMLEKTGLSCLDDLYSEVPDDFVFKKEFDIPESMSECELRRKFDALANENRRQIIFAGAGAYDHYSPSAINPIISRSEYLTAYTPYQAEISQGTLRYIFEYQSLIAELTGMDVSNASMYDGPTAAAEAMMMAVASAKKKNRIVISSTLLPQVREVIRTYAGYHGIDVTEVSQCQGETDREKVSEALAAGDVAGVILPGVNRYGIIEDLSGYADEIHASKAFMIVYSDPSALAVLKSPGEWGADIVCGEAQSLGIPLSFGGPYIGFLACRMPLVRKLPGRIVGETTDVDGKRAFVLTLQAREQHIRREKATSNICSNESLMALYVTVYMSLMGPQGLREVNDLSYGGAHYLHDRLLSTGLFKEVFDKPFIKEFVLESSVPADVLHKALSDAGYFAALPTEEGYVSFCVTEKRTKEEIDSLVETILELKGGCLESEEDRL